MSWEMVELGKVCQVARGGSPRPISKYITDDEDGINWIKIGDTSEDSIYIKKAKEKIVQAGVGKSRKVFSGDLLLSNSMSFGRPYILQIDGCIHDGWLVIRDENNYFDKTFLCYYLGSPLVYAKFKGLAVGGVVNNLNSSMVKKLNIPLPPLKEQHRIVALLDQAQQLIDRRKEQLALMDTLVQSLFNEMFGDPVTNPLGWERDSLKRVSQKVQIGPFGSLLHKEDYVGNGVPLVNPMHIKEGVVVVDSAYSITQSKALGLQEYRMEDGDIVMGRRGEMGRCAMITTEEAGYLCGTGSLYIRPGNNKLVPMYLLWVLSSVSMKKYLEISAQGATMPNLNRKIMEGLQIPIPPIDLQNTFATRVQQIEKQKQAMTASLHQLEENFNALSQAAFKGELPGA